MVAEDDDDDDDVRNLADCLVATATAEAGGSSVQPVPEIATDDSLDVVPSAFRFLLPFPLCSQPRS